jgi:hypothetical protein
MAVKVKIFPHAKHGIPIDDQYREIYPFLEELLRAVILDKTERGSISS